MIFTSNNILTNINVVMHYTEIRNCVKYFIFVVNIDFLTVNH